MKIENLDYWFYLYAESLYRIKLNTELNCPCSECWVEKTKLNHLLDQIEEEGHIPPIRKKIIGQEKGNAVIVKIS